MRDTNSGSLSTDCKDQDGILPIRKEAWKLQEPLPSTAGNQLTTNFGASSSTSKVPGSKQKIEEHPFQSQNMPAVPPIQHQRENHDDFTYGISPPIQNTLPFGQNQHAHLWQVQHKPNYPIMVPIYCYPCCHQYQQFAHQHYY